MFNAGRGGCVEKGLRSIFSVSTIVDKPIWILPFLYHLFYIISDTFFVMALVG